jgi:hypothetical protein
VGWGKPIQINATGFSAVESQVAMNSSGNAILVWQQDGYVWSNRYEVGTGWDTPIMIESGGFPQIVMDASGNAIVVWRPWVSTMIRANRYEVGMGWGNSTQIDTSPGILPPFFPFSHLEIAMNSNGNAIALWDQFDGTFLNVWANRFE